MMGMKPFQIVVIGIFALLALVGLFVFATVSSSGNKSSVGTVVIWGTLPAAAMTDAINTLKQTNKDYANVSYVEQAPEGFDTALANAIASGAGPDLVVIDQEQLLAEESKLSLIPFSAISERTFLDTYVAEDQLYLTDSGTYGVPIVVDPLVLYTNQTVLASAGIPTSPATWEAVTGIASLVTKKDGSGTITEAAVPFGTYANVTNARAIVSALLLQAGSSITSSAPGGVRSTIGAQPATAGETPPAISAFDFYTQFANPAKTIYSWNAAMAGSREAFIGNALALYPGFASEAAGLRAANPNLDFDMAPLPQANTGTRTTYGLAYAFVIPKAAANKSGAYSAAIALTSANILPALAKELGMAPATRALLTPSASDPYEAVYYPEALTSAGWLSPAPDATDAVFAAIISNIVTGRLGTADALSAGDQSLNAAL